MKDLFDRWGMIIMVFLVVQKKQNPHNKNTCGVSIKLEIDIKKRAQSRHLACSIRRARAFVSSSSKSG